MAYATAEQFVEAFGRDEAIALSNLDDAQADEIDQTVMLRALTGASQLIDSYLAFRYPLPFASVPQALIPKCLDIARYQLDRGSPRDDVRRRYEDALKWLEGVAKGWLVLGLDTAQAPVERGENLPEFLEPEPVYTNETLRGFVGL